LRGLHLGRAPVAEGAAAQVTVVPPIASVRQDLREADGLGEAGDVAAVGPGRDVRLRDELGQAAAVIGASARAPHEGVGHAGRGQCSELVVYLCRQVGCGAPATGLR
jgi:hypothetical protein